MTNIKSVTYDNIVAIVESFPDISHGGTLSKDAINLLECCNICYDIVKNIFEPADYKEFSQLEDNQVYQLVEFVAGHLGFLEKISYYHIFIACMALNYPTDIIKRKCGVSFSLKIKEQFNIPYVRTISQIYEDFKERVIPFLEINVPTVAGLADRDTQARIFYNEKYKELVQQTMGVCDWTVSGGWPRISLWHPYYNQEFWFNFTNNKWSAGAKEYSSLGFEDFYKRFVLPNYVKWFNSSIKNKKEYEIGSGEYLYLVALGDNKRKFGYSKSLKSRLATHKGAAKSHGLSFEVVCYNCASKGKDMEQIILADIKSMSGVKMLSAEYFEYTAENHDEKIVALMCKTYIDEESFYYNRDGK